jgi:Ferritin-like protein
MLSKKLETALNAQVNAEFWSAYLYLSIASYFESKGFAGMANWMRVQFKEEQDHALKFYDFVISRGGKITLNPIEAVPTTWTNPLEVFTETLAHEQKVTELINSLYALATKENDYATQSMLHWFIDEQVEEEKNAQNIIDSLKMIGDDGLGVYQLDKELATRVYTPIVLNTQA